VNQPGAKFFYDTGVFCFAYLASSAGFTGGLMSDKFFNRAGVRRRVAVRSDVRINGRDDPVSISMPVVVALAALFISSGDHRVHSLMSGTAAADFGGRKATATCSASWMGLFI